MDVEDAKKLVIAVDDTVAVGAKVLKELWDGQPVGDGDTSEVDELEVDLDVERVGRDVCENDCDDVSDTERCAEWDPLEEKMTDGVTSAENVGDDTAEGEVVKSDDKLPD